MRVAVWGVSLGRMRQPQDIAVPPGLQRVQSEKEEPAESKNNISAD